MSTAKKSFKDKFASSSFGQTVRNAANTPGAASSNSNATQDESSDIRMAGISSTRGLRGALVVPLEMVVPNKYQVRTTLDDATLNELAEDIKERGILEPLIVRSRSDDDLYEIIAGQRRFLAAQLAGLHEVPVILREMDDNTARFTMLVENIQREDLDPSDERQFFLTLQNEFNYSIKDIAALIHKSRDYVYNRLENRLQQLQPNAGNQPMAEATANSEENNNVTLGDTLSKNSQSVVVEKPAISRSFKPGSFKKVFTTLDNTLALFETGESVDEKTKTRIRENLTQLRQKIAELEQKIE